MRSTFVGIIAGAGLLMGVSTAYADSVADASATINHFNDDWVQAVRTHDLKRLIMPYAPDAVYLKGDGSTVNGQSAIRAMLAADHSKVIDSGINSQGRTAATPDDVYEWGTAYTVVETASGKTKRGEGRYISIWHRYPGNHWLLMRNVSL